MDNYEDVNNDDNLRNKKPVIKVRDLVKVFSSTFRGSGVRAVDGVNGWGLERLKIYIFFAKVIKGKILLLIGLEHRIFFTLIFSLVMYL